MKQKGKNSIGKLNEAIDYIENHIHDKLTLMQIATAVNLSQYHLHHMFKAMTKQRLMDYTRNRKLARSIPVLLDTKLKLIDIAHQFEFGYEQSYIRAFHRVYKMTPTQFRNAKPQVSITDKLNLACLQELDDDSFLLQPRIVIKPEFWVVGTKHLLRYDDEDFYDKVDRHGNAFFFHGRQKIAHAPSPHMYIGIISHLANKPHHRNYLTALEVSRVENVPPDMVSHFIPSQKYAVFTYVGLHHPQDTTPKHVLSIYEYIFKTWLPHSGYTFIEQYQMEFIDSLVANDDYCEIDLYIPIDNEKQAPSSLFNREKSAASFF